MTVGQLCAVRLPDQARDRAFGWVSAPDRGVLRHRAVTSDRDREAGPSAGPGVHRRGRRRAAAPGRPARPGAPHPTHGKDTHDA